MDASLKRSGQSLLPIIGMFLLLTASLAIMAEATQSSGHFHRWQWWVAGINGALGLILLFMFGNGLRQLIRKRKHKESGSRLSLRMTALVSGFTLLPISMVFGFSVWLIYSGIDSWFDVGVDNALNKAMELSRSSVDLQMRQLRVQVERMMREPLNADDYEETAVRINDLVTNSGALEAILLDSDNTILASQGAEASILPDLPDESDRADGEDLGQVDVDVELVDVELVEVPDILPDLPSEAQLQLLQESGVYMRQDEHSEHGAVIRILLQVPAEDRDLPLVLQTLFPISEHLLSLAGSVEAAAAIYQRLLELRVPLKYNLTFVLSLALLLGLLFVFWAALYTAQIILAPIPELARGIDAVAEGNYTDRLPVGPDDELAQLSHSFNDMISRLAQARYIAETQRSTIEDQRAYLHTVLNHQSSGVISVDHTGRLKTANRAAETILDLNLDSYQGQSIDALREAHPKFEPLWNLITRQLHEQTELEQQLQLRYGQQFLHCQGALLPKDAGCVVVFADSTDLLQAQRLATWGEVARRLAHEIKNPLTPIRLSAERVQRRLQPELDDEDADMLQRATQTIVRQVDSIKAMIDDFSAYASSRSVLELTQLNDLVAEVRELYLGHSEACSMEVALHESGVWVKADPVRIRQLLHNLIKNALEAQSAQEQGSVVVRTTVENDMAVLHVEDSGPGFSDEIIGRVFEPYITTKPHGNGLGLAVVERIVEDHHGNIRVYNNPQGGGCVEVQIPLSADPADPPSAAQAAE